MTGANDREDQDRYLQNNTVHPGGSLYAVLHGDMHIRNGCPVYRVEPFPLQSTPPGVNEASVRPSRLLAAENRIVEFTGRRDELAELSSWRDNEVKGVSVKLVHGPGGQGKTRLAAQFAADSAERGWTVWSAHHLSDPTALTVVVPGDCGPTLLLIVEYAERWPVDDLQLLLGNSMLRRPERTRVLLVARPAGNWWPSLRHRLLDKMRLDVAAALKLESIAVDPALRWQVVTSARDQFATALGAPVTEVAEPPPEALTGPGFDLVLTLHMAALVAVYSRGRKTLMDSAALSAYLLDREHDYWQTLYDHDQVATPPQEMARTSYLATLTRPLTRQAAVGPLTWTRAATPQDAQRMLGDHALCYPPAEPGTVLEPLYPDRLGEDFIALRTPGHSLPDYVPDDWATAAPTRLLAPTHQRAASPHPWTRTALTVLIETANRWRHVAEAQLYTLLTTHPHLAVAAGGAALIRLTEIRDIDVAVLEAIEPHLPRRSVDFAPAAAAIAKILTDHRLGRTDDPAERAHLCANLASVMLEAGLPEEALPHLIEATTAWRRLIMAERNHLPDLAISLNGLSGALSKLGRHVEAVAAAEEGAGIFRDMPQPVPALHGLVYAGLLQNLGISLSDLGDYERALAATQESVRLRRQLAETAGGADYQLSEFADALSSLGNRLWRLGQHTQALAPAQEAVGIYRQLARTSPDIYEPGLASCLNNLALRCFHLGRYSEGLPPAQEAVAIRRRLVRANRPAYLSALAGSLDNLATLCANLRHSEEALDLTMEAVELYRQAARNNPAAHLKDLATALTNLANGLGRLQRHEQALDCIQQAVAHYSVLVETNPDAHLPDLGGALNNFGEILSCLGYDEQALARTHEAVDLFQGLAETNPDEYLPGLAASLNNLAVKLWALGHREQAMDRIRKAIGALRGLPPAGREAHLPLLAKLLSHLGDNLYQGQNFEQAVFAAQEMVEIYRRLAGVDTTAYQPHLAVALIDLGNSLGAVGQYGKSLAAFEEGMALYAQVRDADPDAELPSSWGPPDQHSSCRS
ncbi:tetratricopeptide repeat protein [Streptomyces xantholiticus]